MEQNAGLCAINICLSLVQALATPIGRDEARLVSVYAHAVSVQPFNGWYSCLHNLHKLTISVQSMLTPQSWRCRKSVLNCFVTK
jgi:hypothetical protein